MDWQKAYAIVRLGDDGLAQIVHWADKIKDARYWLGYIALPGDAVFQTPVHPKSTGGPAYQGHLVARGTISHDEKKWLAEVVGTKTLRFPE